jgi:hypothetical protein
MSDLDDRCLGVVPAFDQLLAGPHPLTVVQIAAGNTPNLMFSSTNVMSRDTVLRCLGTLLIRSSPASHVVGDATITVPLHRICKVWCPDMPAAVAGGGTP